MPHSPTRVMRYLPGGDEIRSCRRCQQETVPGCWTGSELRAGRRHALVDRADGADRPRSRTSPGARLGASQSPGEPNGVGAPPGIRVCGDRHRSALDRIRTRPHRCRPQPGLAAISAGRCGWWLAPCPWDLHRFALAVGTGAHTNTDFVTPFDHAGAGVGSACCCHISRQERRHPVRDRDPVPHDRQGNSSAEQPEVHQASCWPAPQGPLTRRKSALSRH